LLTKEILAAHSIEAKLLFTALLELNDELLEHNLHLLSCALGIGDRVQTLQCCPRLGCRFWLCRLPLLLLLLFIAWLHGWLCRPCFFWSVCLSLI